VSLTPGARLGAYEVLARIGAGGMGEVWRARDTKLTRNVALKILPEQFAADPDRLARFKREAQLLASLNHPNIGGIYGLEETDGVRALVLELVEGPTLADRIAQGPIPLDEALPIARQIAEALEAAHEQGIVHRDLKPSNIKLRPDGTVKVLDFGLAKALEPASSGVDVSQSPTITSPAMTRAGVILGTAAYMAPEQAKGKSVDKRVDIWAFGCVFYEMLTGRKAFEGETFSDTIAAVVKNEPDWNALPVQTPSIVQLLLQRCLNKDRQERLHDIADWRIVTKEAARENLQRAEQHSSFSRRDRLLALLVVAVLLIVIGLSVFYFYRVPGTLPEMRVEIATPPTPDPVSFAISPNGEQLVFLASSAAGKTQLWLRPLNSVEVRPLADTDGASYPFWSPDSRAIGFFADGKLKRIDLTGGPSRTLASAPQARGGTWSNDGLILFTPEPRASLYRVASSGGEAVAATRLDPPRLTSHRAPYFLPDGQHFLFYGLGDSEAGAGVYVASLDQPDPRRLLNADSSAVYAAGHLLFVRQGTLFAQRFDADRLQLAGEPFQVASQVASRVGFAVSSADTGAVVYRGESQPEVRQLAWFDRRGQVSERVGKPDNTLLLNPELSPDGKRVAVERDVGGTEVWLMEVTGGETRRLTFGAYRWPVWSPDGSRVIFASVRTGFWRIYQKLATGAGQEEQLPGLGDFEGFEPTDWSLDGRFLLIDSVYPKMGYEISALPLDRDPKPFRVVTLPGDQRGGQFSPDGRWIAYQSNEYGTQEIFVQPFPGPGGKTQISTTGGTQPRWRADGRELFYVGLDGTLMATPISFLENGTALRAGTSSALFSTHLVGQATVNRPQVNRQQYDVSPDGQRFLMNITIEPEAISPLTAIVNWRAESAK
jgi:serine/threonine protein kinase